MVEWVLADTGDHAWCGGLITAGWRVDGDLRDRQGGDRNVVVII